MSCKNEVVALPDLHDWTDPPTWHCVACKAPIKDCDHSHQEPTPAGWSCVTCKRTLLGPPPLARRMW